MQRYRYEIDNVRSHLRSLWAVIALQLIVILRSGWLEPGAQTAHRACPAGSAFRCDAGGGRGPPPTSTLCLHIFQQLNRWPEDGAKDYGKAIFRVSPI